MSKLPSCIYRAVYKSDITDRLYINSPEEQKEPVLCTTYAERMNQQLPLAADPSIFRDAVGKNWMVLGNFWNGIHVVELDREGQIKGIGNKENPPKYTFVAKGPKVFSNDGRHEKGGAIG